MEWEDDAGLGTNVFMKKRTMSKLCIESQPCDRTHTMHTQTHTHTQRREALIKCFALPPLQFFLIPLLPRITFPPPETHTP